MGCTPTPATLTCCAGLGCRSDNADIPILKPDFHLLVQLVRLPIRLSLCFPASLKTYQREQQGAYAPAPSRVNGKTWQASR